MSATIPRINTNTGVFSTFIDETIQNIALVKKDLILQQEKYIERDVLRLIGNIALKALAFLGIVAIICTIPLAVLFSVKLLMIAPIALMVFGIAEFCNRKFFGHISYTDHLSSFKDSLKEKMSSTSGENALRRIEITKEELKDRIQFFDRAHLQVRFDRGLLRTDIKILKITSYIFKSINEVLDSREMDSKKSSAKTLKRLEKAELPANFDRDLRALLAAIQINPEQIRAYTQQIMEEQPPISSIAIIDVLLKKIV